MSSCVRETNHMNLHIPSAAEEQSEDINQNITKVSRITDFTVLSMREVNSKAGALAPFGEQLQGKIQYCRYWFDDAEFKQEDNSRF